MCLITLNKRVKIAKQDIVCYKRMSVFNNRLFSSIRRFPYELGKSYVTTLYPTSEYIFGKHIYPDSAVMMHYFPNSDFVTWVLNKKPLIISEGFHAYTTIDRISMDELHYDEVIVQMTIPKGARYYTDATGLIVANKIICNEIIKL